MLEKKKKMPQKFKIYCNQRKGFIKYSKIDLKMVLNIEKYLIVLLFKLWIINDWYSSSSFFLWKLFKKINIRFKLVYSLYIFTRCFIMALDNQMVFKYKSSTVIGQRCNIVPRETSFDVNWSHQRKLHNIN